MAGSGFVCFYTANSEGGQCQAHYKGPPSVLESPDLSSHILHFSRPLSAHRLFSHPRHIVRLHLDELCVFSAFPRTVLFQDNDALITVSSDDSLWCHSQDRTNESASHRLQRKYSSTVAVNGPLWLLCLNHNDSFMLWQRAVKWGLWLHQQGPDVIKQRWHRF